jgi:hypothetical protein
MKVPLKIIFKVYLDKCASKDTIFTDILSEVPLKILYLRAFD